MNQIEINKIVRTVNGEVDDEHFEVRIYHLRKEYTEEGVIEGDRRYEALLSLQPSQMKELKEKIAKLDL